MPELAVRGGAAHRRWISTRRPGRDIVAMTAKCDGRRPRGRLAVWDYGTKPIPSMRRSRLSPGEAPMHL